MSHTHSLYSMHLVKYFSGKDSPEIRKKRKIRGSSFIPNCKVYLVTVPNRKFMANLAYTLIKTLTPQYAFRQGQRGVTLQR